MNHEQEPVQACPPSVLTEQGLAEIKIEKIPISREHFIMAILDQIDYWEGEKLHAKLESFDLQHLLQKIFQSEALGMQPYFFLEKKTITMSDGQQTEQVKYKFEAREKGKFGFRGSFENNNEEPAQK